MKNNLPYLTPERLTTIFESVYDIVRVQEELESVGKFGEERLDCLLVTLQAMQSFNYGFRPDDTRQLFGPMNSIFKFERNSDGTTLWLSLILAIKELYGFSDHKLYEVMAEVKLRK